jgi:hypothetical protein
MSKNKLDLIEVIHSLTNELLEKTREVQIKERQSLELMLLRRQVEANHAAQNSRRTDLLAIASNLAEAICEAERQRERLLDEIDKADAELSALRDEWEDEDSECEEV